MARQINIHDYEAFYDQALHARKQIHNSVPSNIKSLAECQSICRSCGKKNDGTFVDLDDDQEFEFEPSIRSYRVLFQRTSLQFVFSAMPDMPMFICGICCYKIKIFYLMTRQFIIGQNAFRSSIAGFYRSRYDVEPPEQLEDRNQLKKQLALANRPPLHEPFEPINEFIKDCDKQRPQIKRSCSIDTRLRAGAHNQNDQKKRRAINERTNNNGCHTSRSNANLRYSTNQCASPVKKPLNTQQRAATSRSPALQRSARNANCKESPAKKFLPTPRPLRLEPEDLDPIRDVTRTISNPVTKEATLIAAPPKRAIPPSKAQQLQLLKERAAKWR